MAVYPERRSNRLSGEWIAEVTHVGVRVRKRFDTKHETDRGGRPGVGTAAHEPDASQDLSGPLQR
jgi:hypothetical protein